MVIKNILLALEAGLGHGETPIFPIHIFKIKDGVNYKETDPNYDLFELACKVSAKRLFPNFSFIDAPFNLQYYKEGNPDTEIAYMGCVQGDETITYRIDDKVYVESFQRFWNRVKDMGVNNYGISEYVNTENKVEIFDSSVNGFVNCKKLIKNPNKDNWVQVKFNNGRNLTCTLDHPLPVLNENGELVRTFVKDMVLGMKVPMANVGDKPTEYGEIVSIEKIEINECSYDVETESDRFDVSGIQSHNCRTRVIGNTYDPTREIVTGRGNLSFTSINLPRLAIEANKDIDKFFDSLNNMIDLVIDQLMHRFRIQCQRKVRNHPFLMGQGVWIDSDKLGPDDTLEEVLKHGTLSVGFIGLAETLKCLIGKHHGESEEARELGYKIIKFMRTRMDEESKKTGLNWSLLATPAEGLSGRFVGIDAKRYGIIEGVTDRDYYTNSFHVPVYYQISAAEKIRIEAPFHDLTNAGHITYIELDGDPSENLVAFKRIVQFMKESGIGYGAINHPVDRDPVCGYTGIIGDECPGCGRHDDDSDYKFERIRRITGYITGTIERWNNAKRAEERDRVKHG